MRPRHRRLRDALYSQSYTPAVIAHLAGCRSCRELAGRLEHIDRYFRKSIPPEPKFLLARILRDTSLRWLRPPLG